MSTSHNTRLEIRGPAERRRAAVLRQAALVMGCAVAAMGLLALAGWAFGIADLRAAVPGEASTKASTALAFVALGSALALMREGAPPARVRAAAALAALAAGLGALTLAEYVLGVDLGIDELLFEDVTAGIDESDPGRMGPNTALALALAGGGLAVLDSKAGRLHPAELLGLCAALVGLVALMGHAIGVDSLSGIGSETDLAPQTAAGLLLVGAGILCARPSRGGMGLLIADDPRGDALRTLGPFALLAPALLGALQRAGDETGVYGDRMGEFLWAVMLIALMLVAVVAFSRSAARRDGERHIAAERLRSIVDTAPDAIVTADSAGRIVAFNHAAERIFGRAEAQALGESLTTLMPERFHAGHEEGLRRFTETGEARVIGKTVELEGLRADGGEFPLELSLASWEHGGERFFTGLVSEISERKRRERELVQRTEDLATRSVQLESSNAELASSNAELASANSELVQRTEDLATRSVQLESSNSELVQRTEDLATRSVQLESSNAELASANSELVQRTEDLATRSVQLEGSNAELASSNSELVVRTEQLATRSVQLESSNTDLARSNSDLEQFAYIASHDLSEPLRSVSGFVQLLQRRYEGQLDSEADRFIGFAVDGVARMQALIEALLLYSRAGRGDLSVVPVDSAEVVAWTVEALGVAIGEAHAEIEVRDLPVVNADEHALGQVFQNLIGNAVKYRDGAQPRIEVSAAHGEDEWRFSVEDNGIGIEPRYAERVFQMFQRLHPREEYSGTGVGLAVCKTAVERHGGRIWCEPRPTGGTAFHFTIPDGEGKK